MAPVMRRSDAPGLFGPEFPLSASGPTDNIHLTASACNCQSGLQCKVLPRAARAAIRNAVGNWSTVSYWLDLGNNADGGQFILGEPLNERNRKAKLRLRSAAELFPDIVDPNLDNDEEPS